MMFVPQGRPRCIISEGDVSDWNEVEGDWGLPDGPLHIEGEAIDAELLNVEHSTSGFGIVRFIFRYTGLDISGDSIQFGLKIANDGGEYIHVKVTCAFTSNDTNVQTIVSYFDGSNTTELLNETLTLEQVNLSGKAETLNVCWDGENLKIAFAFSDIGISPDLDKGTIIPEPYSIETSHTGGDVSITTTVLTGDSFDVLGFLYREIRSDARPRCPLCQYEGRVDDCARRLIIIAICDEAESIYVEPTTKAPTTLWNDDLHALNSMMEQIQFSTIRIGLMRPRVDADVSGETGLTNAKVQPNGESLPKDTDRASIDYMEFAITDPRVSEAQIISFFETIRGDVPPDDKLALVFTLDSSGSITPSQYSEELISAKETLLSMYPDIRILPNRESATERWLDDIKEVAQLTCG